MQQLNRSHTGVVVGLVFGAIHAIWSAMVALQWAKPYLDWVLGLHFVELQYSLAPFALGNALVLVVFTFVVGYAVGYAFAYIWNALRK